MERLPGGRIAFLAPLPLPTGEPAQNEGAVSELNATWLDYGAGWPGVFGNQFVIILSFGSFLLMAVVAPFLLSPFMTDRLFNSLSDGFTRNGLYMASVALIAGLWGVISVHSKRKKVIPTRFHRQRREVCFVPEKKSGEGYQEPVFVPWESLRVWVFETRGATQYGVQQQYGMGVGYAHPETGKWLKLEYMAAGLPLAISNWEALRAYMEYEVHSLHEIQDPHLPRGKDDPPWEGVHTLRNARCRMRERRAKGEVGPVFAFFWYAYHVIELWNLPGYLTEWEAKRLMKTRPKLRPAEVEEWSKPLPKEQWAKPSEELVRLSAELNRLRQRDPHRAIEEIFADAYRRQGVEA